MSVIIRNKKGEVVSESKNLANHLNLTPSQQIVLKRFAQTGTATVAELKKHYSYWCPPIKSLKAKGLVRFNTIRQWWELTKEGASFMPIVLGEILEPEERKTMTKSEALELLKSENELTEEQLEEVREALRKNEDEVNEDEWSSSGSYGDSWSSSY